MISAFYRLYPGSSARAVQDSCCFRRPVNHCLVTGETAGEGCETEFMAREECPLSKLERGGKIATNTPKKEMCSSP